MITQVLKLKTFFKKVCADYNWWGLYILAFCVVFFLFGSISVEFRSACLSYSPSSFELHKLSWLQGLLIPAVFLFALEGFVSKKWAISGLPILALGLGFFAEETMNVYFGAFVFFSVFFSHLRSLLLGLWVLIVPFVLYSPYFFTYGQNSRSDCHAIKANMNTLQTILETYAIDHKGAYPVSLLNLKSVARADGYWKDVENMTTKEPQEAMRDVTKKELRQLLTPSLYGRDFTRSLYTKTSYLGISFYSRQAAKEEVNVGKVLYYRPTPFAYVLYGIGYDNRLIREPRGKTFVLTNG